LPFVIPAETPGGGGYAFVEDDQLDELTALCSFLAAAGIAVNGTDPER
jgi:hypothetical protein